MRLLWDHFTLGETPQISANPIATFVKFLCHPSVVTGYLMSFGKSKQSKTLDFYCLF